MNEDFGMFIGLISPLVISWIIALILFAPLWDFPILSLTWWVYPILVVAMAELIFLLNNEKPSKSQSVFWFTFQEKMLCLLSSLILVGLLEFILTISRLFYGWAAENCQQLLQSITWVGGATILVIVYVYLNSLRYRTTEQKVKK